MKKSNKVFHLMPAFIVIMLALVLLTVTANAATSEVDSRKQEGRNQVERQRHLLRLCICSEWRGEEGQSHCEVKGGI